ncbi:MAG TPA: hypothetical protein VJ783_29385 [Pirellulales bacterium]|nr:hypothetical protein [Pirellulales bacterium]
MARYPAEALAAAKTMLAARLHLNPTLAFGGGNCRLPQIAVSDIVCVTAARHLS